MFVDILRTCGNNGEGLGHWESEIIGRFVVFILQVKCVTCWAGSKGLYALSLIPSAFRDVH
jgi:hypothetical protein